MPGTEPLLGLGWRRIERWSSSFPYRRSRRSHSFDVHRAERLLVAHTGADLIIPARRIVTGCQADAACAAWVQPSPRPCSGTSCPCSGHTAGRSQSRTTAATDKRFCCCRIPRRPEPARPMARRMRPGTVCDWFAPPLKLPRPASQHCAGENAVVEQAEHAVGLAEANNTGAVIGEVGERATDEDRFARGVGARAGRGGVRGRRHRTAGGEILTQFDRRAVTHAVRGHAIEARIQPHVAADTNRVHLETGCAPPGRSRPCRRWCSWR